MADLRDWLGTGKVMAQAAYYKGLVLRDGGTLSAGRRVEERARSWCCGWPATTRVGATRASAAHWPTSATTSAEARWSEHLAENAPSASNPRAGEYTGLPTIEFSYHTGSRMDSQIFSHFNQEQEPSYCGPCCLSYCLALLGVLRTRHALAKCAGTTWRAGTHEAQLTRAARRNRC